MSDWTARALCAGTGHEPYFAHHQKRRDQTVLLAGCHLLCPVQVECLNHALNVPETFGCWGGFTEQELFGIRTRRFSRCKQCEARWPKGSLTDQTTCRWCDMNKWRDDVVVRWGDEAADRLPLDPEGNP